MKDSIRKPMLLGYGALVIGIVLALIRVEAINNDLQDEIETRQQAICVAYDDLVVVLRSVILETGGATDQEAVINELEEDNPKVADILRDSAERSTRFRERATTVLDESECPKYSKVNNG